MFFGYHCWPHVEIPRSWATILAASGNTTIVVIGNHYGVKAGVVGRDGPEIEVGGYKLDHSSIFFWFRLPKLRYRSYWRQAGKPFLWAHGRLV